ncbi:hypothetical protein MLD38_018968 [Melastoma candidum]|uniref:Uncharacterized protein n=1 Tax=Melastoma candidum TaxID=119954 RepID=A0ACB9QYL3_9MYRT|nr:hypothetical protein MLD38_018968 [Melastoma candidum]
MGHVPPNDVIKEQSSTSNGARACCRKSREEEEEEVFHPNTMKAQAAAAATIGPFLTFDHKRDAYGFAVRPHHVAKYREYANIYKEEEEERSERWGRFLQHQVESAELPINGLDSELDRGILSSENDYLRGGNEAGESPHRDPYPTNHVEHVSKEQSTVENVSGPHQIQIWTEIRPSLQIIEDMMSARVKKNSRNSKNEKSAEDPGSLKSASEDYSEDEFYDVEKSESSEATHDTSSHDSANFHTPESMPTSLSLESLFPWKEELEVLVRGGVPMALRGELWQAFVGASAHRVKNYYQGLLVTEGNAVQNGTLQSDDSKESVADSICMPEKWKGQIEKDLPRTFPGHPALDEDGRNALRRLLTAYARHNPSVGYCQAMNFFAGLLLLLMPEENAFWTLLGILDDYFEGYYSEEMIESQVDQLVFEELVRERFPKLVNHLDFLGVQIAWVTGPWFLSIFMNMLPWESVLRVWDVLLFEGNRVMLFRTALALMELYGPALVTTKDTGDAVTLLQSLVGSTFDSSQLVLTACMGYQNVHEKSLEELRNKHRAAVIEAVEERAKGFQAWRDSKGLASKLYGFRHNSKSLMMGADKTGGLADDQTNGDLSRSPSGSVVDGVVSLTGDVEVDSVPDLQSQVVWLKGELCKLLEEKRSAIIRSEELETALMEMVQLDNRRELSAKVEKLEQEVVELRRALSDKQEQESAMLKVLMRVEQEQRVTEDARIFAEQDAAAQRYTAQVLKEKYEEVVAQLAEMEKRAIMAESMLEATLQYQTGQVKAQPSPRSPNPNSQLRSSQESTLEIPQRKISILSRPFALGWRDRNKDKMDDPTEVNTANETQIPIPQATETDGVKEQDKDKVASG